MPDIKFREKFPGEWVCQIGGSGFSTVEKAVLKGMSRHIGACLGRVFGCHELNPYDRVGLNGLLSATLARYRAWEIFGYFDGDESEFQKNPGGVVLEQLLGLLDYSFMCMAVATDSVVEDIEMAVELHGASVRALSAFETSVNFITSMSNEYFSTVPITAFDPVALGIKGSEVRWAARDKVLTYALKRFDEREWVSVPDAAKRLLPDICKIAIEVDFKHTDNLEKTVAKWFRAKNKSV